MKNIKNFEPKNFLLVLFLGLMIFSSAEAQVSTVRAEGFYILTDENSESPAVAKERAHETAKQAAVEQIQIYVESISKMSSGKLTDDVIRAVACGVLRILESNVTIETTEDDKLLFRCRLIAQVDSDNVNEQLLRSKSELQILARRNSELENRIEKINAELQTLKKNFALVNSDSEREKLQDLMRSNEKNFAVAQLVSEGNFFMLKKDFRSAVKSYEESLKLSNEDVDIFCALGDAYLGLEDFDAAKENFMKAAQIDPNCERAKEFLEHYP